ncbi:HNH endonuclease [Massilia sp. Root351]|uniref:HNH endonuclease n=1 Tax=Massilia sp. Root351 TaxID=1736522 RepID=UPI001E33DFFE|nr:HNH endonuclease signature motif containing protein [Massilia sp. Root351]
MRASLFQRHPLCAECLRNGRASPATQRDHVIPLAEGGPDDETNEQALCDACHDAKSKQEPNGSQHQEREQARAHSHDRRSRTGRRIKRSTAAQTRASQTAAATGCTAQHAADESHQPNGSQHQARGQVRRTVMTHRSRTGQRISRSHGSNRLAPARRPQRPTTPRSASPMNRTAQRTTAPGTRPSQSAQP